MTLDKAARGTWPFHVPLRVVERVGVDGWQVGRWKCLKCAKRWPSEVSREVIEQGTCDRQPGSRDYEAVNPEHLL